MTFATMIKQLSLVAILIMASLQVQAADLIFSLGLEGLDDDDDGQTAAVTIEYVSDPIFRSGPVQTGYATTVRVDFDNDVFIGVGISSELPLRNNYFFESSATLGYYGPGREGTDLGGNVQFRSVFGIGRNLSTKSAFSIAVDHTSNSSIENINPGIETLIVRYLVRF